MNPSRLGCFAALGLAAVLRLRADNTAVDPTPKLHLHWLLRQFEIEREVRREHPGLIFVGDSIVERFETQGRSVWDRYYAPYRPADLGIGGDLTEHVLWRLEHGDLEGISPRLAVVMVGQNNSGHNSAPEIAQGIEAVVQTLRAKLPDTKILLLAIFPRGPTSSPERTLLAQASAAASRLADNRHIFYLDLNAIFLRPDGTIPRDLMADYEHPTPLGYRLWAEAMQPEIKKLMGSGRTATLRTDPPPPDSL